MSDEGENLSLLQKVAKGYRCPLPLEDEVTIVDALQAGRLSLKVAAGVWVGLNKNFGVPVEVVNVILAYSMPRRLFLTPYLAPRARILGDEKNPKAAAYTKLGEVVEVGRSKAFIKGINDHNSCFSVAAPFPLRLNERFTVQHSVTHQNGLGIVTQRWSSAQNHLRFSKEAICHYCGLSLMHSHNPEQKATPAPQSLAFTGASLHLGICPLTRSPRRYVIFWDGRGNPRTAIWVPEHFDRPEEPEPAESKGATTAGAGDGEVSESKQPCNEKAPATASTHNVFPPLFAAIQVWNNGTGAFNPVLHDVQADPLKLEEGNWEGICFFQ